jgi:hypothetical protein
VDIDPERIKESLENAKNAGVQNRTKFLRQDLFKTDLTKATVITMYLLPDVNMRLRPTILGLKPGTRIVSHAFDMGDWKPDQRATVDGHYDVYHWVVPAPVEGQWSLQADGAEKMRIQLSQKFQEIEGTATIGTQKVNLENPKVTGERIVFDVTEGKTKRTFTGTFKDGTIEGTWMAKGKKPTPVRMVTVKN